MTTDITELAQRMKAAAEKATPGEWVYFPKNTSIEYDVGSDESQGSILYVDSGDFTQVQTDRNGEFIALANPANILALVEALEKAQRYIEELREWNAGLAQESFERQQRIAELELHKAALLKFIRESCYVFDGYDADISDAYIDAASSNLMPKIEAEPCHHCSDGSYSGLPGGACEHCMGTGLDNPAAELESRTVKLPKLKMLEDYLAEVAIEERKQILVGVKLEFHRACVAAGIKVEAE
ncbi:ead/Ea22-like family protein [Klebsiella pneumoniae]|uniref:ead/Ea22-like family protein n=1 Tax=Klebsiella pneumoniae TaxID=573 RepID=UPI00217D2406|nr:ead/Ea22-like family protein [Klebsiella pneumoniae]MCS6644752.1 ead/Ea22-like family protein [Klebsiella pneumoniae subsp. pneumoniae]HCF8348115.1 ead/Ea22-like family protein [Klebsiella pneumoniae]